jgi:hypothetical protein
VQSKRTVFQATCICFFELCHYSKVNDFYVKIMLDFNAAPMFYDEIFLWIVSQAHNFDPMDPSLKCLRTPIACLFSVWSILKLDCSKSSAKIVII